MENQTNNNQLKKERDEEIIHKEVVKQCGGKGFEWEVSWGLCRSNIYLSNKGLKYISKIKGLKNIKELYLDNNEIENIWSLAHLINLTQLDLSHNKIDDIEALEKLTELKALDLSYNEIRDISPLFKLYKLECLNIKECKNITTEQIEDLKKALPNCTIRKQ